LAQIGMITGSIQMEQNKIKQIILEAFETTPELTMSQLILNTSIAKRTAQRYVDELIQDNRLIALGQGRSRYYQRVYVNEEILTRLAVLKNGSHIGTLIFGNGRYEFVYEKGYEDLLFGISTTNSTSKFFLYQHYITLCSFIRIQILRVI
jgi:predicted transcriptional regulator